MSQRIFVGNLPFSATEGQLNELFSKHGDVNRRRSSRTGYRPLPRLRLRRDGVRRVGHRRHRRPDGFTDGRPRPDGQPGQAQERRLDGRRQPLVATAQQFRAALWAPPGLFARFDAGGPITRILAQTRKEFPVFSRIAALFGSPRRWPRRCSRRPRPPRPRPAAAAAPNWRPAAVRRSKSRTATGLRYPPWCRAARPRQQV